MQKGSRIVDFLAAQRSRFLPVLVAGGVILASVYGYDWWANRRLEKGWESFHRAIKAAESERLEKLKTVYRESRSIRPGQFAAVRLGDYYFDEAKRESEKNGSVEPPSARIAVEWYGNALNFSDLTASEKQLLLIDRGNSYELQKKIDDAIQDYETAVNQTGDAKGWALMNLGRAWELKNNVQKAIDTYQRVTLDFATSEYSRLAKNHIRRLKSPHFR